MNAMLAIEILRWHGLVEPQRTWFDPAQAVVNQLIDEHSHRGSACLPFTSTDGNARAWDLTGFYVWSAVVV